MFRSDKRIKPYRFKTLKGRYIHLESKSKRSKRVFVVIYGQHASIERCMPLIRAMSYFGEVYLADCPGFGGMDPAYKIKRKPDLDFFAENIKNIFDKVLPKNKKITVFAMSFGFQQVVAFLKNYPDYHKRIEDVISFVGLTSYRDFNISWKLETTLNLVTSSGKTRLGSKLWQGLIFQHPVFVRSYYEITGRKHPRFSKLTRQQLEEFAREEAWLWQINERRTHAQTANDFLFNTDLTNIKLPLRVVHVGVPNDHFLNNRQVLKGLNKMFNEVMSHDIDIDGHSPVAMNTSKKILALLPDEFAQYLKKSENK